LINFTSSKHFLPGINCQGFGKLHGKEVTNIPDRVQMAVKPAKTQAVYFAVFPGRIDLMKMQTEILAHPKLAM